MRSFSILLAFVSAFALLGCTSGAGPAVETATPTETVELDPKELVASAAANTTGTSYRYEMQMRVEGIPQSPPLALFAEGAVDEVMHRMSMRIDMSDFYPGMGPSDMLFSDQLVYVRGGPFAGLADTEWGSADVAVLGESGEDLFVSQNPGQQFELLEGARDFVEAGTEVLRGVSTTRWDGTIDLAVGADEAQLAESIADLGATADDITAARTSIWIGADGFIRRSEMTFEIAADAFGPGTVLTYIVSYENFDFGDAVRLDLPPSEDVTDVTFQIALAMGQR